jgi:hypothetical protein
MMLLDLSTQDIIQMWGLGITILGSIIFVSFRIGGVFNQLTTIKDSILSIRVDIGEVDSNLNKVIFSHGQLKVKVDELWRKNTTTSGSPMILNENGKKVLIDSNIKSLTNKYYPEILNQVKSLNPPNPFQAQELLIQIVGKYRDKEECKNELESAAYNSGNNVETVLFVAAIDIRDKIVSDLGFSVDDIDLHDPSKKSN